MGVFKEICQTREVSGRLAYLILHKLPREEWEKYSRSSIEARPRKPSRSAKVLRKGNWMTSEVLTKRLWLPFAKIAIEIGGQKGEQDLDSSFVRLILQNKEYDCRQE